jgi:hypothetical protein
MTETTSQKIIYCMPAFAKYPLTFQGQLGGEVREGVCHDRDHPAHLRLLRGGRHRRETRQAPQKGYKAA